MPTLPHPSDKGKHPARTTVVDRRAEAPGIPAGCRLRTPLLGDDPQTPGGTAGAGAHRYAVRKATLPQQVMVPLVRSPNECAPTARRP